MRNKLSLISLLMSLAIGIGYAEDEQPNTSPPMTMPTHNYTINNNYKTVYTPLMEDSAESKLPHLYALHINGIGTTYDEAKKNLENLQKVSQLQSGRNYVVWDVVYNPTAKVIKYPDGQTDINRMFFTNTWDVIHQKNHELNLNN